MTTSFTQCRGGRARTGFTLIEIMIVVAIIAMITATMLPRLGLFYESPTSSFQQAVEEASGLALSGVSVRFTLKHSSREDSDPSDNWSGGGMVTRGELVAEAYLKQETGSDLSSFLGTTGQNEVLAWTPIKLEHLPTGDGWSMDPAYVYFFTDGSCTPARITWSNERTSWGSDSNATVFYLTVTGYCATPPQTNYSYGY